MKLKILTIAAALSFFAFLFYQLLLIDIPDISFLKTQNPKYSSYMNLDTSKNNKSNDSVSYVPLSKVSRHIIKAIIASEDDLYFIHNGFNWKEISQSIEINLKRKKFVRGGSTITQQLARNLFLSKDKSLTRKLREWILTHKLESQLSKRRILSCFLISLMSSLILL